MKKLLFLFSILLPFLFGCTAIPAVQQERTLVSDKAALPVPLQKMALLAQQGNASAQVNLGTKYRDGLGVQRDYKAAVKWFTLAAKQGDVNGQGSLAAMYFKGSGVPQDRKIAVKWYTLAAEQGKLSTQQFLGVMHSEGLGIPRDYKIALKWFTLAAKQGYFSSQIWLGGMYERGRGVPQDYIRAHMWYSLAGSNDSSLARARIDSIAKKMSSADIANSQKLARECLASNYKAC